jgi:hypothetical protein
LSPYLFVAVFHALHAHNYASSRRRKLDRIVQQVENHTLQAIGVGGDLRKVRPDLGSQSDGAVAGPSLIEGNGIAGDLAEIHRAAIQSQTPALPPCKVQQLVDQPDQPVSLAPSGL